MLTGEIHGTAAEALPLKLKAQDLRSEETVNSFISFHQFSSERRILKHPQTSKIIQE